MNDESFESALPAASATVPDLRKSPRRRQNNGSTPLNVDRVPPHSIENEQGVLGCILQNPKSCIAIVMGMFAAGDEVFYDMRHQTIYANAVQMFENNKEIDIITLQQRLKDFDMLDGIGGLSYLNTLQDSVPSAANLTYYADTVQEKYLLRKMIGVCTESIARVWSSTDNVDAVMDEIERNVLGVRKMSGQKKEQDVRELVNLAIGEIEKKFESKGAITGLATGFADLDSYTDGLHPGEMTILCAFPSVGKTALAMNIAENVVLNQEQPVGVFSMEMTSVSLVKRALCSTARVNLRGVIGGQLGDTDFPKLTSAAGRWSKAKIYFDDESDLSIFRLRAKARRMVQQFGVKLIVVDYLQLMNAAGGNRKLESRNQEVADISNGLKAMSKELNIPVLALSQLTETANGPRLRGSADILQDADGVWMLDFPKSKEGEIAETPEVAPIDLWIRKQRNGPRNVCVKLAFMKIFTRFESLSRMAGVEVPATPTPEPEPEPTEEPAFI